ncbi:hypothetical protein CgunFtcFv8_008575 [Champsocephalus gunnari]|uniref:Uncharacterized protein n=1 Tax=Champsocephalus gunnari TaxID=52237 RepID=A0AAN8DAJ0_CHAGU|nr:hypothetical protein CgunFtcFv8_008575 [Champsocephalus gunnari]
MSGGYASVWRQAVRQGVRRAVETGCAAEACHDDGSISYHYTDRQHPPDSSGAGDMNEKQKGGQATLTFSPSEVYSPPRTCISLGSRAACTGVVSPPFPRI